MRKFFDVCEPHHEQARHVAKIGDGAEPHTAWRTGDQQHPHVG